MRKNLFTEFLVTLMAIDPNSFQLTDVKIFDTDKCLGIIKDESIRKLVVLKILLEKQAENADLPSEKIDELDFFIDECDYIFEDFVYFQFPESEDLRASDEAEFFVSRDWKLYIGNKNLRRKKVNPLYLNQN